MKNKEIKISIILAALSFIGGLFLVPYQLESMEGLMPKEEYEELKNAPMMLIMLVSSIQMAAVSFGLAFFGLKIAKKAGLRKEGPLLVIKPVLLSLILGMIGSFALIVSDKYYFMNKISALSKEEPAFSLFGMLAGMFYGGVFEEVMMRLFLMSLLVWMLAKIFNRGKESIADHYYWAAIFAAALVFGAAHLPATSILFGELNTVIVIRCLFLNSIGGIFFGYLYWKNGLQYSILSHAFLHLSMQMVFIPIYY